MMLGIFCQSNHVLLAGGWQWRDLVIKIFHSRIEK